MQDLCGRVVVITGASSGIGRALALAFARHGSRLVLAARRQEALEEAARLCVREGAAGAIAVPTDVADAAQTGALAQAAVREFGGIDLWANIAGVAAAGPFEGTPLVIQNRLVAVNLTGVMNGSHAALTHMLGAGGGRGVIINMASLAGRIPQPFMAAYSASKFGVAGFTDSLRSEVLARSAVQVCGVYPTFVDTPALRHAANYTGRSLRPVPPVLDPEAVAERILRLARNPRRALHLGAPHASVPAFLLAPEPIGRMLGRLALGFVRSGPRAAATEGTVLTPGVEGTGMRDGWLETEHRLARSLGFGAMALAAGVAGALLVRQAGRRRSRDGQTRC